ncbi:hypothetical protein EDD86DRAFT_185873 [Gorgonomyces haynaldii]|nr:hypothetical protein EDD86DRAFT_185873 [Gorgonomyces haynaldii]
MASEKENTPILGEDGQPLTKSQIKKLEKERQKEARRLEVAARLAAEKAAREAANPDHSVGRYGKLPMNQSAEELQQPRIDIQALSSEHVGQTIQLRGRVHVSRPTGSKMLFVTLRQKTNTVQSVLTVDETTVSKQMLKFATSIPSESLVVVEAVVLEAPEKVKSCTVHDYELKIEKIHVVSEASRLPFTIEDAQRPLAEFTEDSGFVKVDLDTRLNNRIVDLRTTTNQAVFRIQAGVCRLFRDYLDNLGFVEIHTPKMIAAASEGGANVFEVTYFKEKAYLAQSPQLYKQMMICADFDRVYEIGPVFRAEDSNTHRHMTEFVGLDLEMAFQEHYHEVLKVIGGLFTHLFKGLETKFRKELDTVQKQYPFDEFLYLDEPLVLHFAEGIKLLREAGVDVDDFEDLSTANERKLGELVRQKYKTDFYILDKFPLAVRPFYTMPDAKDPKYSNSYDMFIRGEEILSGAQRIHDAVYLEERAREHGVDIKTIQPYIDAFKYGAPPHAGGGIGLERVVMLYLNLKNIRRTSLFPRDPKRLTP